MTVHRTIASYQKPVLVGCFVCLLIYFIVMDLILYDTLMRINLADEKLGDGEMLTVFHPLSPKMIMNDHVTHYISTHVSEALCYYTNFGVNFNYISPNMISFTHLGLGILSAKFVFSDSLYQRRLGVVLFEIRSFLDAFDGTVYRSHAVDKSYKSDHNNFGYWVDISSDVISGVAFCFAILFYLWWKNSPKFSQTQSCLPVVCRYPSKFFNKCCSKLMSKKTNEFSKLSIFWCVLCFGFYWFYSAGMWDKAVINYHRIFTTHLDVEYTHIQQQYLHSTKTWVIMWLWRILGGQSILQMVCIAVFVDKPWEFFRLTQYTGIIVTAVLSYVTTSHSSQIQKSLGL